MLSYLSNALRPETWFTQILPCTCNLHSVLFTIVYHPQGTNFCWKCFSPTSADMISRISSGSARKSRFIILNFLPNWIANPLMGEILKEAKQQR